MIESIGKNADEVSGNRVRVKIVKNKVAPPFRKCELDLMFGSGISYTGSLLDAALKYELIEKAGAWYSYNGEKIGQGRDKTLEYIKDNPEFSAELDSRLREVMFPRKGSEGKGSGDVVEQ